MPRTTIRSDDITDAQVKTADMAVDPTNASNLSSGDVPAAQLGNVPLEPVEDDIAVLGFQVAAANDLAKYSLRDQIVDTFQDATGVDASASTNETRDSSGKYYEGAAITTPSVSGNYNSNGTDGDYSWYKWTTVTAAGSYTTDTAQDYEYLVIGGGGGGGWDGGGGAGAGGYRTATGFAVAATTISSITVGAGGVGGTSSASPGYATAGSSSIFSTITSYGGGGGSTTGPAQTGTFGSGGGGYRGTGNAGAPATAGQGYAGGSGEAGPGSNTGGGGGGAGEVGNADGNGDGGDGTSSSIDGSATTRAGGGGGAGNSQSTGTWPRPGGDGGGGYGTRGSSYGGTGGAGTVNTGSGGGAGGAASGSDGGVGGSGIVIIRRPTTESAVANMTLVSTATTAEAGTTATGDFVILYTPQTGTTTLNTDLIASVSRDNGANYTPATLLGKGSYSGTTQIASAHNIDISGQPAGVAMRWKIATVNQSLSKETRINGVSLGWS